MKAALAINSTTVRTVIRKNKDAEPEYEDFPGWDMGVPGLVIVRLPDRYTSRYSITHKATGLAVCFVNEFEDAVTMLDWLGDEGTDWSHPNPAEEPHKYGPVRNALRENFSDLIS